MLLQVRSRYERGVESTAWGPNALFRYPRNGTGAAWAAVWAQLSHERVRFNASVVGVDLPAHKLRLSSGVVMPYDRLVSTMPLDRLLDAADVPQALHSELDKGFWRQSCNLVGFGLACALPAQLQGVHWLYFPEEQFPFYRATIMSNLSPHNVPNATLHWSVLTETGESSERTLNATALPAMALAALRDARLVPPECAVVSTWQHRLEYGYPVPYLDRNKHFAAADAFLLSHDVRSRGRFGAWKYEAANQDHACQQGVEAIDAILFASPEHTVNVPNRVNLKYTAHKQPVAGGVFSRNRRAVAQRDLWTFVIAHCYEPIDAAVYALTERALPARVRYSVFVYEYCGATSEFSMRDNEHHVTRIALPDHVSMCAVVVSVT
jgi:hypothetical protein